MQAKRNKTGEKVVQARMKVLSSEEEKTEAINPKCGKR